MEVMTHVVNFVFKKIHFSTCACLYDTQVIRKYNISEEKNVQMFSYMLNVFSMCLIGPPGPLGSNMEVMTHVVNFVLAPAL